MNRHAILHIPLSEYAYSVAENRVIIRLRTAKGDVSRCVLKYADKQEWREPKTMYSKDMRLIATDLLYDYYEADVGEEFNRICYYFCLETTDECLYYYDRGFTEKMEAHCSEYFQFPYIRREEILDIPDWAEDVVMYQIFPDSFATDRGFIEDKGKDIGSSHSKLGGTLKGITANLDYIAALGINAIYINPVFTAVSYHKYDTTDYLDIDPCFGTKDELKQLVKESHIRGIRVILDGVFNHSGPEFFAFKDVLAKGRASEFFDWFYDMPDKPDYEARPVQYATFAYVREMPKLNTSNPRLRDYLCEVGRYWIKECDIDGWRLDVANEIDHDFWRAFRKTVREVKPDCFLIGEIWEESRVWLRGDQFDSTMNYSFAYLCRDFFALRKLTPTEFNGYIQSMLMRYPTELDRVQMNLLDSHDVPRFLTLCEGDRDRYRLALLYMYTAVGIPCIFYGDECYMEGESEDQYRSPMPWGTDDNAYDYLAALAYIRHKHPALRKGDYRSLLTDDASGVYVYERSFEGDRVIVMLNNGDGDFIPDERLYTDRRDYTILYGENTDDGVLTVRGCSALILGTE